MHYLITEQTIPSRISFAHEYIRLFMGDNVKGETIVDTETVEAERLEYVRSLRGSNVNDSSNIKCSSTFSEDKLRELSLAQTQVLFGLVDKIRASQNFDDVAIQCMSMGFYDLLYGYTMVSDH